jgi:dTDP-3,4-didehydro-2,6-dideoxy-alpha-D-glucose 3-reductase
MNMLKIGVLGCANIAQRSVIPSILKMSEYFTLVGIASRSKGKVSELASQFHTEPYYGYETLLNNAELDAVYIPLPNSLHAEWIDQALSRNIHVLVEKTMACEFEDVVRLNEKASQKGLVLMENFQFRFHEQLSVIKSLVDEGKIGEIRCLRSSFGFPPFKNSNDIRYKKSLGGGALLDVGAYPIKISQIFLGQDIGVTSANLWFDEEKNVDIWGGGYLKQKNGPLFAEIAFGFDNYYQCNLELWGSGGSIVTNRIFTAPPDFSPEIIIESSSGKEIIHIEPCNHFENMLRHFHDLVNNEIDIRDEYKQNISQAKLLKQVKLVYRNL